MTSAPVMSSYISQTVNNVGLAQHVRTQDGGADFRSMMEKPKETPKAEPVKARTDKSEPKDSIMANDTAKTKTVVTDEQTDVSKPVEGEAADEMAVETKDVIEKVESILSDELNVSKEQIEEALSILGLTVAALLDQNMIPAIVAELTGEDAISIATDEDMFGKLMNVSQASEEAVNEITDILEVPKEEVEQAVKLLETGSVQTSSETKTDISTDNHSVEAENDLETVLTEADAEVNQPQKAVNFEAKVEVKVQESVKTDKSVSGNVDSAKTDSALFTETDTKEVIGKASHRGTEDSQAFGNNSQTMNFAQTIIAKATEIFNETAEASNISYSSYDVENILNQMTDFIKADISAETSEISMRLHPETLGTVSVKISANNEGVLTATFTAQNEAVKAVIESQAVVLKETLEAKGTTVEAVEVLLQSHEFDRNLNDQNKGQSNGEMNRGRRAVRRINLTDEIPEDIADDEAIVREMMAQNGNTVDYSA